MSEEAQHLTTSRKRKPGKKKGSAKKKLKSLPAAVEKVKVSKKMKKLFRKRARQYNSDDDDDDGEKNDGEAVPVAGDKKLNAGNMKVEHAESSDEEGDDEKDFGSDREHSEGEDEIQPGITRFTEGSRAFRTAFNAIINKNKADEELGPVLAAHKQLIAKRLAEEEAERKVKGEAKKEKHAIAEKGHVRPVNYLNSLEKFLIGVATKGVVKLFNAVNKAQSAQKGLNSSRSKDAKEIKKRRKEAFFSELSKTSTAETAAKGHKSSGCVNDEGPGWAPLRDNYMLTNPKLKDWDKKQDIAAEEDFGKMSGEESSDED